MAKRSDLKTMPLEDLKELAKKKQKNGNASPDAYWAQCEIANRVDRTIGGRSRPKSKRLSDEYCGHDIDYGEDLYD